MELTNQEELAIEKQELKNCLANIHTLVIRKRVADKVKDKAAQEACMKALEQLETSKDELEAIIKEHETTAPAVQAEAKV